MKMQWLLRVGAIALGLSGACGDDDPKGGTLGDGGARADAGPDIDARVDAGGEASVADARSDGSVVQEAAAPTDSRVPTDEGGQPDASSPTCDATREVELPSLALMPVVSGRDRLVYAAQPPGSSDWYLVHQKGRIDVFAGGMVRNQPFLDVSSTMLQSPDVGDERGLLSVAFAPDYATSGKFYVAMTPNRPGDANENRDLVLEYTRSAGDPYQADANSRKEIVALEASAGNHNGGTVLFGPDGMLYVGTGDGGGGCNNDGPRQDAPQKTSSLFGKILRLDPKAAAPYAAAGNPFSGMSGDARVLHLGLRNPFRFGFDKSTGDLYIADVGQVSYEELSFAPAAAKGLNFGWAEYEGAMRGTCPGRSLAAGATHTPPIVSVDVRDQAPASERFRDYVSIVNGPVYRGNVFPTLQGALIFGDYNGRRLGVLRQCGSQTSPVRAFRKSREVGNPEPGFMLPSGVNFNELTAIVEDNVGELYVVANRGALMKIVPGT
jgi:glucose/arabinose dehydrogenase